MERYMLGNGLEEGKAGVELGRVQEVIPILGSGKMI
jgi:hypothetical protein